MEDVENKKIKQEMAAAIKDARKTGNWDGLVAECKRISSKDNQSLDTFNK